MRHCLQKGAPYGQHQIYRNGCSQGSDNDCSSECCGKLVMESIIETKAITILEFVKGLRGELQLTFEEGIWASWLYDLLQPHVKKIVVCNPRRNALLKEGSKSDKVDARKLAELLYAKILRPFGPKGESFNSHTPLHQPR